MPPASSFCSRPSLLIAGTTSFDANEAALAAILAEWNATYDANSTEQDYQGRVKHLESGGGGLNEVDGTAILLNANTVQNNAGGNVVNGSDRLDLIFAGTGKGKSNQLENLIDSDESWTSDPSENDH